MSGNRVANRPISAEDSGHYNLSALQCAVSQRSSESCSHGPAGRFNLRNEPEFDRPQAGGYRIKCKKAPAKFSASALEFLTLSLRPCRGGGRRFLVLNHSRSLRLGQNYFSHYNPIAHV